MIDFLKNYLSPSIVAIGVIFIAINNYRKDNNSVDDRLINNYKALDEQQKAQLEDKDAQILKYQADMIEVKAIMAKMREELLGKISNLQGQSDSKDKQIADLQQTILNRNPDLEKVLKEIRDFMKEIIAANLHQTKILDKQVKDEADIAERDKNLVHGRTN